MIVLKCIIGFLIGLAIIDSVSEIKEKEYGKLFAIIVMLLIEIIIIKGWEDGRYRLRENRKRDKEDKVQFREHGDGDMAEVNGTKCVKIWCIINWRQG